MFSDRIDAARKLVKKLKGYKGEDGVVMAIPRGGVPLGYVIADELGFPLDLALVKKIGHPMNKEYAIGSVSMTGKVINREVPDVSEEYIENETKRLREILKEKYDLYMDSKDHAPVNLTGKTVIIVDDGIATGSTLRATVDLVRESKPSKIIVAIPVGPPQAVKKIEKEVEEMICLYTPSDFFGVGQFYENFEQVSDNAVIRLLKQAKTREVRMNE